MQSSKNGYTLLELLLSVSVFAILAAVSLPLFRGIQERNDLSSALVTIAHSSRRAQLLASSLSADSPWGVSIQSGLIKIFKGTSFAARDATFDEDFTISGSIILTGANEFVFQKNSLTLASNQTITLESPSHETKTITINTRGTASY